MHGIGITFFETINGALHDVRPVGLDDTRADNVPSERPTKPISHGALGTG